MIRLELNDEERAELVNVLKRCRDDLWMEISHSDALEFKEILRERDRVLMQILQKLGAETMAAAT